MNDEHTDDPVTPPTKSEEPPVSDTQKPDTPPVTENIMHFNPWRDFNDAAAHPDVFGDEPDAELIATFLEMVFGYCDGLVPVRSFIDKGQGYNGRPHNIWVEANVSLAGKIATFAQWASREGAAVYVIPGTVAATGQAGADHIVQMQTIVVDLDTGDIAAKRAHLARNPAHEDSLIDVAGYAALLAEVAR